MIRVLFFLAVLAALAFAGVWLIERPGEVVMTVEGYRIETTLIAAAGAVLAVALALRVLWGVIRFVLRAPASIGLRSRARRRAKGFAAVSRGMVAVGAGDPRTAKRHADDAGKLLGDEPLALLLKAQAAQMAGDRSSAEGAFRQMLDEPETRVLGLRGLFVEARRKGDSAAARAYAAEAARLAPTVSWAGEALLEFQCADGDWTGALNTLERGAKGLDKATVKRQRAVLLVADAMSRAEKEPEAALARAQEALKLAPTLVPAATLAARLLSRRGDLRKASRTVETVWSHSPHPELAEAYINVRPGDSALDRLKRAERLLALRPHDAEARIAVATAAIGARDAARARDALKPLLEADDRPSVRVCLLMADVEEIETGGEGAVREWFARASRAPRDPAWIADGVISDRWAPVSPVSGRLDAFVWGTPVEQLQGYDPDRPAPGDRARFALSASDAVMGDVHEAVALAPPHEDSAGKDAVPASEKLHRVDAPAAVPQEPAHPPMPAAARVEPAKPQPARVEAVRPNGEAADAPDLQPAPPPVQSVAPEAHEETHGDGRPAQPGYVDRPRFTTPDPSRETQAAVGPNPGEAIPHRAVDAVSASPTPQAAIQASPAPEPPVRPAAS
ncbi:MAG: heme biosynthesis HemY N-terminal domain-containing protein, partial [Alsobacter sp.]